MEQTQDKPVDHRLLFTRSSQTDVCLLVGGTEFYAKKSVLSRCSFYFQAMFQRDWKESAQSKEGQPIYLEGISSDLVRTILHFLYTNKVIISEDSQWFDKYFELIETAHYFGVHEEMEIGLGIHLRKHLQIHTVFDLWQKFLDCGTEILSQECERFLIENFDKSCTTNEFLLCPRELLRRVLRGGDIDCDLDDILNKLKLWAQFNIRKEYQENFSHSEHIGNMEGAVKKYLMDLLPPQTLFNRTLKYSLLTARPRS